MRINGFPTPIVAAMCAALAVFTSSGAFGQSAAAPPAFEVASVKPAAPPTGNIVMRRAGGDPGMVRYDNASLTMLIARAYGVKNYQISGPDWLDSGGYDVVAKAPAGAATELIPAMLQALLAERFKLTLHRETKTLPVYALIVGKGGPKLKEADPASLSAVAGAYNLGPGGGPPPPGAGPSMVAGSGAKGGGGGPNVRIMMTDQGREMKGLMTMAGLTNGLSNFMDRPVLDMTGLKGTYDIDISWMPDENERRMGGLMGLPPPPPGGDSGGRGPENAADPAGASIFSALDQLGLKLDPRKSEAEILVIDHVERVPTEN
jgi:uncharacterized protein (TIGR03435 family)